MNFVQRLINFWIPRLFYIRLITLSSPANFLTLPTFDVDSS